MDRPEVIWRRGTHPRPMLEALPHRPSDRKLRYFALACARLCGHLLADPRSVAAVEFAERYAEVGTARRKGRPAVLQGAFAAWQDAFATVFHTDGAARSAALAATFAAISAYGLLVYRPWECAFYSQVNAANATANERLAEAGLPPGHNGPEHTRPDDEHHARLLCDVLGDPFTPVEVHPGWLTRDGGLVSRLARAIDEEGAYDRLPVLADALEDAGCAHEAVLAHCRGPGPHVRGCWVIDLLLGRE